MSVLRARRALLLPVVGLLLLALAAPVSSLQAAPASLRVTPSDNYIGGQALTFSGNIGQSGQRRVTLESHMGRPGDDWLPIAGFSDQTAPNGDFSFAYPAPSMFNISYRVVSGGAATPKWTFEALSQDLTVEVVGGQALAGVPFQLLVDTTPTLRRRPDTIGLQPIPGRELTLQRRVDGDTWETLDTTTVNQLGVGLFTVIEAQNGTVVYRVRQEDWTQGANEIGWFPSFPTYVEIGGPLRRDAASSSSGAPLACNYDPGKPEAASATASTVHGWAPSVFDFAWVLGESLTSPPYRGTKLKGKWIDYTDGAGRVNKHNGGLMLDSKRENECGNGDFGTTRATLQGNPLTYGRWETRLRLKSYETNDRDYRTLVELVPERASDYACGGRNITIAEMTPHGSIVKFGANAMSKQWNGSKNVGDPVNNRSLSIAVEVTKTHVSWFLAGKVIGTVKSRAASSDVPMTMRLSLVGDGDREMNHTGLISDWQRGFTLARGQQVKNGKALNQSKLTSSC